MPQEPTISPFRRVLGWLLRVAAVLALFIALVNLSTGLLVLIGVDIEQDFNVPQFALAADLTSPVEIIAIGFWLIVGIVLWQVSTRTLHCQPKRQKTRDEEVSDLMYEAGKLDHRGEWNQAIEIYRQIEEIGNDDQIAAAQSWIKRIEAKKAAAGAA